MPVQRVSKSQTDSAYVEGLWAKITEQLKLASEGDSDDTQPAAFDQLAKDFETLKNHCLTSEETLHDIKARNMYNMVDQVSLGKSGSPSNLMFLTNKQGTAWSPHVPRMQCTAELCSFRPLVLALQGAR